MKPHSYILKLSSYFVISRTKYTKQLSFFAFHKMGIKNHSHTFWREAEEFKHLKTLTVKKRGEDELTLSAELL